MSPNQPNKVLRFFKKTCLFFRSNNATVNIFHKFLIFLCSLPLNFAAIIYFNLFRSRISSFPMDIRIAENFKLNFVVMDTIACYLYLFGIWEPDCTSYICKNLKHGKTFVDVGANIGYYSLLASKLVGEKGRVISIEASPKIYNVLQNNVHLNSFASNIETHNLAITDKLGKASVYLGPDGNLGSTTTSLFLQGKFPYREYNLEAEVDAVTLDLLIESEGIENLQMIKIDVEGTEREVIYGLVETIKNGAPEILIELTPLWWSKQKPSIEEVLQPFFEQGYNAYIIPNSYLPWRYLWPSMVQPPKRATKPIRSCWGQLDMVLSKSDQEYLS
jgi:FkbM family methyltransferase